MREAEESGRRQAELRLQKQQDEIFRQVMKVHQESVESYLEDLVAEGVERVAGVEARRQVREVAERVNRVVDELERRYGSSTILDLKQGGILDGLHFNT